jgi:hypothetical protein
MVTKALKKSGLRIDSETKSIVHEGLSQKISWSALYDMVEHIGTEARRAVIRAPKT